MDPGMVSHLSARFTGLGVVNIPKKELEERGFRGVSTGVSGGVPGGFQGFPGVSEHI